MKRVGRPTKFDDETRKRLLAALATGVNRPTAANFAYIHERTLYDWLDIGENCYKEQQEALERGEVWPQPVEPFEAKPYPRNANQAQRRAIDKLNNPDQQRYLIELEWFRLVQDYAQFYQDVKQAESAWKVRDLQTIARVGAGGEVIAQRTITRKRRGADGEPEEEVVDIKKFQPANWQALAWRLERRDPEQYGRKDQVTQVGPGGGPVQLQVIGIEVVPPDIDSAGDNVDEDAPLQDDAAPGYEAELSFEPPAIPM